MKRKSRGFVALYGDRILQVIGDGENDKRLVVHFRIPTWWRCRGDFAAELWFVRSLVEHIRIAGAI